MSKSEIQAETAGAQGGKKKGRVVIIIGVVAALAVCGAGAWLLLGSGKKAEHGEKVVANTPPVFFTLDPFVVNLAGEVQHYLQVGIDLKIADEHVKDRIKAHLPEIRNGVLLLLSSKQIDDLSSLEGKNRLRAEIREVVNQPLGVHTPAPKSAAAAPEGAGAGEAHAAEINSVTDGGKPVTEGSKPVTEAVKPAAGATAQEPTDGVLEVLLTSFVIQ